MRKYKKRCIRCGRRKPDYKMFRYFTDVLNPTYICEECARKEFLDFTLPSGVGPTEYKGER